MQITKSMFVSLVLLSDMNGIETSLYFVLCYLNGIEPRNFDFQCWFRSNIIMTVPTLLFQK